MGIRTVGNLTRIASAPRAARELASRRLGAPAPRVALTADEAVACVRSRDSLFVHSVACAPTPLLEALSRRRDLEGVALAHLHLEGAAPHMAPELAGRFRSLNLFVGSNARAAVHDGRADYVPIFLSEVPALFRSGAQPVDVALMQLSPPDRHGFCSLGPSVDVSRAAASSAATIVAIVNSHVPRTFGDSLVHESQLDTVLYADAPLHELARKPAKGGSGGVEAAIGRLIAHNLVKDGATLQLGIGGVPDAVLAELKGHKGLSIWSEMISDGVIGLVESGVVTNHKATHPGRCTVGFACGSQKLYSWLDDNVGVVFKSVDFVNDPGRIAMLPGITAINSALEVDLTGQVCADSIGKRIYSGVGGQVDFVSGAGRARGGVPIIALPSTTSSGESRIVCALRPGAGVVTTRAHVRLIVTEHGIAELHGKSLGQRARALIAVAEPGHRDALSAEARRRRLI